MIPIRLSIRNFMCYRDNVPPISFESIHIACISGNNGNGKSALIDAITWALWGKTRANNDDELVHAGQSETEVEFEFAVGPQRYRIIRKHSRPKTRKRSGQTILEFQSITPDGYKVLSGDTTTQTQQTITGILHMDYETFINSAFLRQGRADEFTKKRPGERKQVLGNILQLSVYDEMEARAAEKAKQQETLITQLQTSVTNIGEELTLKSSYQSALEQAQSKLALDEKQTQAQEVCLATLRKAKQSNENRKTQLTLLASHIQDTEDNIKHWNEILQQCQTAISTYEELMAQRSTIEEQYRQFSGIRQQVKELDQQSKTVHTLTQRQHQLELTIIKAGEDLNRAHAVAENNIHKLAQIGQELPRLQTEIRQVQSLLKALEETETQLQEKRSKSKSLHAAAHSLQTENRRLRDEIKQVEEKLLMLSRQSGISCPLCETELGADGQKRIENKYRLEKAAKSAALSTGESALGLREAEIKALDTDVQDSEVKLKLARAAAQNKYGNITKAISDAMEAENKIDLERKTLNDIERKLTSRDFAAVEQAGLAQIQEELVKIGYDSQRHDQLRAQMAGLEQNMTSKLRLEEADRLIVQEKENREKARRTAAELQLRLESDLRQKQSLLAELASCDAIELDLTRAETEYQRILSEQKQTQEVIGGVKAKLERLADLEIKNKENVSQMAEANKTEKIFKDLVQAFGKKGIQAMLIETALPEIETEANKLLARMTDNRMHIKMEPQRETKTGDVMETLDINISDELGTRNYEMFSGGEAFRIDFAIRVALSRLLARRAGAPLPTLIIDEGFGTQDSSGIEKIKEAITSIQDDFEKILVITHIPDFKDSFPVRIEVVKTPEGSTLTLN